MELYALIAAILASVLVVVRAVVPKYAKYDTYVHMAFAWVEKVVPDDYGAGESDPALAKMMHKVDLFSKKFAEFMQTYEGRSATEDMLLYARNLASKLAASN